MEEGIKKKVKTNEEGEQELLFESLLSPQYLKEETTTKLKEEFESGLPFPHLRIENLIKDEEFVKSLIEEVATENFFLRSSDLFEFYQSDDLNKCEKEKVQIFKKLLSSDNFRSWMTNITGIHNLTPNIDLSAAIYSKGDYLQCHDDKLEGRRIAFIYYLVPDDWSSSDGGELGLYEVEENGIPKIESTKDLLPQRNSFCLFSVHVNSFHQVKEVLSEKGRLTVGGWFHGPPSSRPLLMIKETKINFKNRREEERDIREYINPTFLNSEIQKSILEQFENESQICLANFLREDKYNEISELLKSANLPWKKIGPPLLHSFSSIDYEKKSNNDLDLSPIHSLVSFFRTKLFAEFLNSITGLKIDQQRGDIRKFERGNFTLCHNNDDLFSINSLDCLLFFADEEFDEEWGGYTSYCADGDELFRVFPNTNSFSLVYTDKECSRFVKLINHKSPSSRTDLSFNFTLIDDGDNGDDNKDDKGDSKDDNGDDEEAEEKEVGDNDEE